MAAAQILVLALALMAITNAALEFSRWNFAQRKFVTYLQIMYELLFYGGHYKHGDDANL
jgi:hypothetical protein